MAPNTKFKPKRDPLLSKKERDWVDESEQADITDKGGVCDRACYLSVMIGHLGHCSQIKHFDSWTLVALISKIGRTDPNHHGHTN